MKNKLFVSLSIIFVSLLFINLCSAWIVPDSHDDISLKALALANSTTYGKIVSQNFDDFIMCNSLTDYSVFYYFTSTANIGAVYLASHNSGLCERAIGLADKNNNAQVACALGICSMDAEDSSSHNGFVPMVITRTGLVNGIDHAPAEECVNSQITTKALHDQGINAIVNKYQVHRNFLIKVFQSDNRAGNIDVGTTMDAFVAELTSNQGYTVGFRGFTVIPTSIHVILILVFLFLAVALALLIRKKKKGVFSIIFMFLTFFGIMFIILLYVLYFTGHIWEAFQFVTDNGLCHILPYQGWETYYQQAINNEVGLLTQGSSYLYTIPDPAGQQALAAADASGSMFRWIIGISLVAITVFLVWFFYRRSKNKK